MNINNNLIKKARAEIERIHGPLPHPQRSYIVLMSPRSGSNLLCVHLEKIGFGRPMEGFHFNPKALQRKFGWPAEFNNSFEHIRYALDYGTLGGVFGLKLSWVEFELFLREARQVLEPTGFSLNDGELLELFFPDAAYIHLKRRNKVKQAVSYAKAMQNGIWQVDAENNDDYKKHLLPAQYDRDHIESLFDNLLVYDLAWERLLRNYSIPGLVMWYEDLARDYVVKMKEIYAYLGIDREEVIAPPLKKQSDELSQDWVQRFEMETHWLSNPDILTAMQAGDFETVHFLRTKQILRDKERKRWVEMPANRFKSIRKFAFRVRRKLSTLVGIK